MTVIPTPTTDELRVFYPISTAITDVKRQELFDYVRNHVLIKMFGYEAAIKIISGAIADSAGPTFIGFKQLTALLCAYQEIKDPLVSTNFGAKIVDRPGVTNPSNQQKSIVLIDIETTISMHYRTALTILGTTNCEGVPTWGGYFSYKIYRL
jgi:hypothetical protein